MIRVIRSPAAHPVLWATPGISWNTPGCMYMGAAWQRRGGYLWRRAAPRRRRGPTKRGLVVALRRRRPRDHRHDANRHRSFRLGLYMRQGCVALFSSTAQYMSCGWGGIRASVVARRPLRAETRDACVHEAHLLPGRVRVRSLLGHLGLGHAADVVVKRLAKVERRHALLGAEPASRRARREAGAPPDVPRGRGGTGAAADQWCMSSMSFSSSFRSRSFRASASSGVSPGTGAAPTKAATRTRIAPQLRSIVT